MNEQRIIDAVRDLYYAAHWSPDRPLNNEVELWEELREAAGFTKGGAPEPRS